MRSHKIHRSIENQALEIEAKVAHNMQKIQITTSKIVWPIRQHCKIVKLLWDIRPPSTDMAQQCTFNFTS